MHDSLTYRQEIYRKFIHLSSSGMALALWYFGKETFLPWLIGVAIILPLLDYGRHHIDLLRRIYTYYFTVFTRPIEYRNLSGASWVVIGATLTTIIFNENTAIIGLLVLSLADSAAAIIGLKFGNTHLFNKSLEGSFAFLVSSSIIIFSLSLESATTVAIVVSDWHHGEIRSARARAALRATSRGQARKPGNLLCG